MPSVLAVLLVALLSALVLSEPLTFLLTRFIDLFILAPTPAQVPTHDPIIHRPLLY
jgi:hypothetical protein